MAKNPRPLNETDRNYLEGNEIEGCYRDRPDKLDNRIKETANDLPERFEQLFQDTRLLSRNGYLDGKTWSDEWSRLLDVYPDDRSASLDYTPPRGTVTGGVASSPSAPERLGRKLGRTASRAVSSGMANTDDMLRELAWGFMKGMWGHPDEERMFETIHDNSRTLSERAGEELEFYKKTRQENQQSFKRSWEDSKAVGENIEQTLDWDGIEPRNWVIRQVERHLQQNSDAGSKPLAVTIADGDESTGDDVQDEILDVVQKNQLLPKQRLINILRSDLQRIHDKSGRGPKGTDTLIDVFENPNSSSRVVSKRLSGDGKWTGGVTEIARDLAGERKNNGGTPERDVWTKRPILHGNNEEWRTTAYGSALSHYVQIPESYQQLKPLGQVPESVVSDAIEELGLHSEDSAASEGDAESNPHEGSRRILSKENDYYL